MLRYWMQVDLISLDMFKRLPFRMKASMVKAALQVTGFWIDVALSSLPELVSIRMLLRIVEISGFRVIVPQKFAEAKQTFFPLK
jgi:hypothetical protein